MNSVEHNGVDGGSLFNVINDARVEQAKSEKFTLHIKPRGKGWWAYEVATLQVALWSAEKYFKEHDTESIKIERVKI